MTTFEIVELREQHAAVVRDELPVHELPSLFDRAFHAVQQALVTQHVAIVGPPFGFYPRMPGDTVAVAAGFPVSAPITPAGEVVPLVLPGGRAVQCVHTGPFDALAQTYDALLGWAASQGIELATRMWESYLTDPSVEPDPATWRTLITWPVREAPTG